MSQYFRRRELKDRVDYEESYWGIITDPDGNVRDRLQERMKHLEDVKQELEYLNALPGGRLLDVGCGLGYLLSGLGSHWEKHGVEVSGFAARHAREWGSIHHGTLESATYEDGWFDAVVLHHVIEHVSDPIELIGEVRRVLKAGGVLVLGTPDFDSACARRFGNKYRLLHDSTHISLFTNDSMHRFLRDYGFVIDRVEYPYFETRYFTRENLLRLLDVEQISPPFYGNFMTFYARRPAASVVADVLQQASRCLRVASEEQRSELDRAVALISRCSRISVTGPVSVEPAYVGRVNAILSQRAEGQPLVTGAVQVMVVKDGEGMLQFDCDNCDEPVRVRVSGDDVGAASNASLVILLTVLAAATESNAA